MKKIQGLLFKLCVFPSQDVISKKRVSMAYLRQKEVSLPGMLRLGKREVPVHVPSK
jgi:hypothetical protein